MRLIPRAAAAAVAALALSLLTPTAGAFAASKPDDPAQTDVVGGTVAPAGRYPFVTAMHRDGEFACGGSLISPDVVLTARHCIDDGGFKKLEFSIGGTSPSNGEKRVGVKWKTGATYQDDWAVVKLDKPVTNKAVALIPTTQRYDTTQFFWAAGWGHTKEGGPDIAKKLRQVRVPLVLDAQCGENAAKEICAGDWELGGVDTCQGDSGGPLMVKADDKRWILVGLTSWGNGCARPKEPGHYAQVSAFHKEIAKAIKELCGKPMQTVK